MVNIRATAPVGRGLDTLTVDSAWLKLIALPEPAIDFDDDIPF
jgi:hypothetical protein